MTDHVRMERRGAVLALTLARPEKKNALTNDMYGALADAIGSAAAPETRAVLIRADGDMFTAGNDLGEFAAFGRGEAGGPRHVGRFLDALVSTSLPLVAAVRGKAVGVGTTMLLHCDLVVLAEDAELTTPFVNLALVPEAASSMLLPERIGHARAFGMFALGEAVSAKDALSWGLANAVVPADALDATAFGFAERLAARPAESLAATKRLMRRHDAIRSVMAAESVEFNTRLRSTDAREAFAAFAERRRPEFNCPAGRLRTEATRGVLIK